MCVGDEYLVIYNYTLSLLPTPEPTRRTGLTTSVFVFLLRTSLVPFLRDKIHTSLILNPDPIVLRVPYLLGIGYEP